MCHDAVNEKRHPNEFKGPGRPVGAAIKGTEKLLHVPRLLKPFTGLNPMAPMWTKYKQSFPQTRGWQKWDSVISVISNTHQQSSISSEHHLGPALSLVGGAANFTIGEYVLIRIPDRIQVDGHFDEEVTAGTALPLTSNGSSPQHFGFIRRANPIQDDIYELEVYPVLSFSRSGGALAGYNEMDDATKATLLPLPPLSRRQPMPEAFGDPIDFGNWTTYKDSWLSIIPRRFRMPTSRPVSPSWDYWPFH